MWKTFSADNIIYVLKFTDNNGIFKINITDLQEIWCDEYDKEKLVQIFKECNPAVLLSQDEETLFQIQNFFYEIDKSEVTITKSSDKIDVDIKTGILGLNATNFSIKYKLPLIKADPDKFKEEFTVPMIYTIHYLENRQKMLCKLIQKKDRELEEYKMEKGPISRSDLATERFNAGDVGDLSEKLMLNVYSQSNTFWETFINKYGNIGAKVVDANVDAWNHVKKKKKLYNSATAAKSSCNVFYKDK